MFEKRTIRQASETGERLDNLKRCGAGQPFIEAGTLVGTPTRDSVISDDVGPQLCSFCAQDTTLRELTIVGEATGVVIHRPALDERVCCVENLSSNSGALAGATATLWVRHNHHTFL
jgi:hypothetical protein